MVVCTKMIFGKILFSDLLSDMILNVMIFKSNTITMQNLNFSVQIFCLGCWMSKMILQYSGSNISHNVFLLGMKCCKVKFLPLL